LHNDIEHIAARAQARVVGVSCALPGTQLDCDFNSRAKLPMASVYKLPIALTVLHQVEEGRLNIAQGVRFLPADLISRGQHSPLRDAHPRGGVDVPLLELLHLAVEQSDGVASDILLRVIGGPQMADDYIRSLGIDGIHIAETEKTMGRDRTAEYRNAAEPQALVALLRLIADRSPLSPANTRQLLGWMTSTPTGDHRIPGSLPLGTVVAHKTGTSGEDHGVTHATNDIGLITLPCGQQLAVAVLIEDSPESEDAREGVIAEITRSDLGGGRECHRVRDGQRDRVLPRACPMSWPDNSGQIFCCLLDS
jgi:beta-lactamase class A